MTRVELGKRGRKVNLYDRERGMKMLYRVGTKLNLEKGGSIVIVIIAQLILPLGKEQRGGQTL